MAVNNWFVYIIETSDSKYYTGITTDVVRRFGEHLGIKGAAKKGAKYFRGRTPKNIVYVEAGHDRSSASQREALIKKLPRSQKVKLLQSALNQATTFNKKILPR